jgi:hypothetical protein
MLPSLSALFTLIISCCFVCVFIRRAFSQKFGFGHCCFSLFCQRHSLPLTLPLPPIQLHLQSLPKRQHLEIDSIPIARILKSQEILCFGQYHTYHLQSITTQQLSPIFIADTAATLPRSTLTLSRISSAMSEPKPAPQGPPPRDTCEFGFIPAI